jgi:tetratricopeptide (TPR) repeat protein
VPVANRRKRQPDDSCIACHMQRFSAADIAHTAATDHRVPRRPSAERMGEPPPRRGAPLLVPFHDKRAPGFEPELARDLGVALVKSMWKQKDGRQPPDSDAVSLLETALRNDPEDRTAWQAKGEGLMLSGRLNEALTAFQSVLRLAPEDENALVSAAMLTQKMGRLEDSLDDWRRAIAVNPEIPMYRSNYALLLAHAQRWEEARGQCQVWMRLEPNSIEARKLWITCLLRDGKKTEARAEFARITRLKPANLGELRTWFRKQSRAP